MTTKQRTAHFSIVELRNNPARPEAGGKSLGLVLEFATDEYWVVAIAMLATIREEDMLRMDPLSREIVENRVKILKSEVRSVLPKIGQPGDVLRSLAAANPWSLHVTSPRDIQITDKATIENRSIEQLVDKFVFTIFGKQLVPAQDMRPFSAKVRKTHHTAPIATVGLAFEPLSWMATPTILKVPITVDA